MPVGTCPDCEAEVHVDLDADKGDTVTCDECGTQLEVVGLDRYNRNGVKFVFDPSKRQLHYDGSAWREILRRHPQSAEAAEARKRLAATPTNAQ